jgi:hypothetical protein
MFSRLHVYSTIVSSWFSPKSLPRLPKYPALLHQPRSRCTSSICRFTPVSLRINFTFHAQRSTNPPPTSPKTFPTSNPATSIPRHILRPPCAHAARYFLPTSALGDVRAPDTCVGVHASCVVPTNTIRLQKQTTLLNDLEPLFSNLLRLKSTSQTFPEVRVSHSFRGITEPRSVRTVSTSVVRDHVFRPSPHHCAGWLKAKIDY